MIFTSPSWFALEGNARLPPQCGGKAPFVDAITGKSYSTTELQERVECLSRALARDLGVVF
ncbi:hypothetical protein P175DRAFT_0531103 [Aspergillus ochraceoroseus IBT 24754]|uniref:Uncharacterized protein n=1 Tax=Aspergillus ochraceoroseus IBT 24754 TaxID=1392256 RepID=A0A2T5LZ87_9EURO|nr:uncharacterized protein P175DRAFT_0531103 [Aspergillus ochraceoroseus IBT 24754]PTU21583.1 hypothetical protein P175DRAFT_0531103 [Aspergillus ochraceoroseus IBT 24754]